MNSRQVINALGRHVQ